MQNENNIYSGYPTNWQYPPQPGQMPPPTQTGNPQIQQPPQAQAQKLEPGVEYVPKKLAAAEVYSHLKQLKNISMGSIFAFFVVNLAAVTSDIFAMAVTAGFIFVAAWFLYKSIMEMKRLQAKYNIDPKQPMNKV